MAYINRPRSLATNNKIHLDGHHQPHHLSPAMTHFSPPPPPTTSPFPDDSTTSYETMLPVSSLTDFSYFKQKDTIFVDDHTEDDSVVEDCTVDNSVT